jgi:hypothetical protein
MGLSVDFIPEYSHIQLTIRRSGSPAYFCWSRSYMHSIIDRILIASIRNLGKCPCPRCLIPLNRVHNLGMVLDRAQRVTMARLDDNESRKRVFAARRLIYKKNMQVYSKAVNDLLEETSQVPTAVSGILFG